MRAASRRLAIDGAPDGWPIPPPRLAYKVSAKFDLHQHLESGALGADSSERAFESNHVALADCKAVLDWGHQSAWHVPPAAYIRDVLGSVMTLVAQMPDAARDAKQDYLLFRMT